MQPSKMSEKVAQVKKLHFIYRRGFSLILAAISIFVDIITGQKLQSIQYS